MRINFIKNPTVPITFPTVVKEEFLKIVTNIFFLTSYKSWIDLKNSDSEDKKSVDEYYQKNLKNVRKMVYSFFKVPKLPEINTKYLVRLYPFSLSKDDPVKQKYYKYSESINKILENLDKKIIPEFFLSDDTSSFEVQNV